MDGVAAIEEAAGEVCADEAGGAGDEDAVMHGCEVATALTLAGAHTRKLPVLKPENLYRFIEMGKVEQKNYYCCIVQMN